MAHRHRIRVRRRPCARDPGLTRSKTSPTLAPTPDGAVLLTALALGDCAVTEFESRTGVRLSVFSKGVHVRRAVPRTECSCGQDGAAQGDPLFRGDFTPWDEDSTDDRWFDVSSDDAPLARQLLQIARPYVVQVYDGRRWLVPTVDGWREQA
jgi:hypothetical protein